MDQNLKKTLSSLPPEKLDTLLTAIEKKTGASKAAVLDAASSGDSAQKLGKLLGKVDSRQLNQLLSDPQAVDSLLSSPKAQKLISQLLGGK